jgi:predicted dehydrogenase
MDNQRPLKVTALTQTNKPAIYARVDDEATVLLEYPKAQGIIQASWNWPVGRKDFEVYGATGYAIATGSDSLRVRLPGAKAEETRTPPQLKPEEADSISYLIGVGHPACRRWRTTRSSSRSSMPRARRRELDGRLR